MKTIASFFGLAICTALILCSCGNKKESDTDKETKATASSPPQSNSSVTVKDDIDISGMNFSFSTKDIEYKLVEETSGCTITLSDNSISCQGSGAVVSDNTVTITSEGTYKISGSLSNGQIVVNVGKNDKVTLEFDNVDITCKTAPALFIEEADKVFILLSQGSKNYLSDSKESCAVYDGTSLDGAIFSRSDLTVKGSGELSVSGNFKHGIVSKDDLIITGGTISVSANNAGLEGKDCVKIGGGVLNISAGSDGIRSVNSEDSDRGFVYISDGDISITAGNDGIQAETVVNAVGGNVKITCGNVGNTVNNNSMSLSSSDNTESAKGIKSNGDILISGGNYNINTEDDSIHASGNIKISSGELILSSEDDGIHSDSSLTVSGGNISVLKSYEGFEAVLVTISGGVNRIVSSDDGINGAGGNDSSGLIDKGKPINRFTSSTGEINISGGYNVIDASGDGVDSNGAVNISGGTTLISGPTSNGNSALDHDGSANVTGGVLVALGSSGMLEGINSSENQCSACVKFSTQQTNTLFSVCDVNGNVLASFKPPKSYSSAIITIPTLQVGSAYTVILGGENTEANSDGYADGGTINGGIETIKFEFSDSLYGMTDGFSFGGNNGGLGGFGGNQGNFGDRPQMSGGFDEEKPSGEAIPDKPSTNQRPDKLPSDFDGGRPQMPSGFDEEKPSGEAIPDKPSTNQRPDKLPSDFDGGRPQTPKGEGGGHNDNELQNGEVSSQRPKQSSPLSPDNMNENIPSHSLDKKGLSEKAFDKHTNEDSGTMPYAYKTNEYSSLNRNKRNSSNDKKESVTEGIISKSA